MSGRLREALPLGVALFVIAIAPVTWREGAAAVALAALALLVRDPRIAGIALGFGFAPLAAAANARGGEVSRGLVLGLSLLLIGGMALRPGRWPHRLLPAAAVGGLFAAALPLVASHVAHAPIDRAEGLVRWPGTVAAFTATLLFFSRERSRGPSTLMLAACLCLAGAIGGSRLLSARHALEAARASGAIDALRSAGEAAERAGWPSGFREARLLEAKALVKQGQPQRALDRLPPELAVEPAGMYVRADALFATGRDMDAMAQLYRAVVRAPTPEDLSPEARVHAALWQLRLHHEAAALANLASLDGIRAPATYRAAAQLAHARAMQEKPAQVPEEGTPLPKVEASFGGVIRLHGARVEKLQAHRGEEIPFELSWEVESPCAPDERYDVFVHFDGATTFYGDHQLPGERPSPTWRPGERFRYVTTARVPKDAPPGRYGVHVGLFSPANQFRLQPDTMPGHIQFVEIATVEVLP